MPELPVVVMCAPDLQVCVIQSQYPLQLARAKDDLLISHTPGGSAFLQPPNLAPSPSEFFYLLFLQEQIKGIIIIGTSKDMLV